MRVFGGSHAALAGTRVDGLKSLLYRRAGERVLLCTCRVRTALLFVFFLSRLLLELSI